MAAKAKKHVLVASAAPALDAEKLLAEAEVIRNPQEDYVVQVELKDGKDANAEVRTYETSIKGRDKALVAFKTPESERGKQVLMDGGDMWVYMPTTAKPIRISPRQKLAGNAAYGDIARLNFSGNYDAKIARQDRYQGKAAVVLALKAKDGKPVTYSDIDYWVDPDTKRPLLAEYKSTSGKVLKIGYFEAYESVFGVQRPTLLRLVDKLNGAQTLLKFKDAEKANLPALLFEKQNLGRS
jgi:outer membrane lipoprotein-sorting protein